MVKVVKQSHDILSALVIRSACQEKPQDFEFAVFRDRSLRIIEKLLIEIFAGSVLPAGKEAYHIVP
jgi:hypothetical protein